MKENDALFVTPHAVAQFQRRIAALDDGAARQMILDGILRSRNVRVLPDGATVRVRTRRPFPFEFRAFCVYDARRRRPVVTTIVRGDSNVTRKFKRKRRAPTLGQKALEKQFRFVSGQTLSPRQRGLNGFVPAFP